MKGTIKIKIYNTGIKGLDKALNAIVKKYGDIIETYDIGSFGYEIRLKNNYHFINTECQSSYNQYVAEIMNDIKLGIIKKG